MALLYFGVNMPAFNLIPQLLSGSFETSRHSGLVILGITRENPCSMASPSPTSATSTRVVNLPDHAVSHKEDLLIVEEPLNVEIEFGPVLDRQRDAFTSTMRTPGNDMELALGLLFSEGIIQSMADVQSVREICENCDPGNSGSGAGENPSGVLVSLAPNIEYNPSHFKRHLLVSSSCGVCGKVDSSQIRQTLNSLSATSIPNPFVPLPDFIPHLADEIRNRQVFFKHTGSVHAAALFDESGEILFLREDVGRHNAMDKVVGAMLSHPGFPLKAVGVFFSGRTSYELLQKSVVAGISLVVSVGAPSSLAVDIAKAADISLIGFLKSSSYNIYHTPGAGQ